MSNINLENDEEVNEFIRAGLLYANQPADTTIDAFDYSPHYKNWEHKLLLNPLGFIKKKSRTAFRRALNIAAAVFITITVIFGALMAASPSVRAAVINWFREIFPTHDAYQFTQAHSEQLLDNWRPTHLPEGYIETSCVDLTTQMIVNFSNESDGKITLNYSFINEGNPVYVNNENMEVTEIKVRNYVAHVYKSQDDSKKNMVVCIDEDAEIVFIITSHESCEVLVGIAESLELSD